MRSRREQAEGRAWFLPDPRIHLYETGLFVVARWKLTSPDFPSDLLRALRRVCPRQVVQHPNTPKMTLWMLSYLPELAQNPAWPLIVLEDPSVAEWMENSKPLPRALPRRERRRCYLPEPCACPKCEIPF